jgi:hypothetical protein
MCILYNLMNTGMKIDPQHAASLVSEPLTPVGDNFFITAMAAGGPGLPARFQWRKKEFTVSQVLEQWKTTSASREGSPQQYVRKHWLRIVTTDGAEMQIYFDRQARPGPNKKKRWWLATVLDKSIQ